MSTNVPKIIWNANGLVLPPEQDILNGRLADINAAFGGALNTTNLETPQGQLASSESAIIGDANDTFLKFVNQVDPTFADGLMQDGIARIYFLNRKPAESTAVVCQCVGLEGTVIPVGARVADEDGNIYFCTATGTIPSGGSIDLPFANQITGPIYCSSSTITKIYQLIPGWDTVSNESAGITGRNTESRAEFENRRYASVFKNSLGSLNAIYAEVFDCPGVTDVFVTENTADDAVDVGASAYSIAAHSVYVAAVGGYAVDIASAIWRKKSCGCSTNGAQEIIVRDMSGYTAPYPEYTIKYEIPDGLAIKFSVSITNTSLVPSDIADRIKKAIIKSFSGLDGGRRERIGSRVYASRYYSSVAQVAEGLNIIDILIGTSTATLYTVAVGIDQVPTVQESDITVLLV